MCRCETLLMKVPGCKRRQWLPQAAGLFYICPTRAKRAGQGQVTPSFFLASARVLIDPTRGIAGRGVERRGRPTETRCCCSSCSDCSCCGSHSGRCSDCCSTTRPAAHGLLLTCPRTPGTGCPLCRFDGPAPATQQSSHFGDQLGHVAILARFEQFQILTQSKIEAQLGQIHVCLG